MRVVRSDTCGETTRRKGEEEKEDENENEREAGRGRKAGERDEKRGIRGRKVERGGGTGEGGGR